LDESQIILVQQVGTMPTFSTIHLAVETKLNKLTSSMHRRIKSAIGSGRGGIII